MWDCPTEMKNLGTRRNSEESNWSLAPGIGIVSRTHSDEAVTQLLSTIATYTPQDTVSVKYNAYAFSVFNTLTACNFSWYIEGAYKTPEVFFDAVRTLSKEIGPPTTKVVIADANAKFTVPDPKAVALPTKKPPLVDVSEEERLDTIKNGELQ